ncbi:MAG: PHP domain-containing protein [Holophagales bacterium]|nr:PHP domain-containing protein [Holophagales bacterium]MYF05663.1 PHP domain-containing protein [Holophagales bacterium]MYJ26874.1 PHP domain-containing protein [Holophagales bacterium]
MKSRLAIRMQVLSFVAFAAAVPSFTQERAIEFPDVDGYRTFSVDLHTHSVFSDGMVWPIIRMQEAERDGLTLIAVTEHLEYQPWQKDIPHPDRNRSYVVASEYTEESESDVIVVNGAEITRSMPPGHVNAVFIQDANALLVKSSGADYMTRLRPSTSEEQAASEREARKAIEVANEQNAFVFWNHPNWPSQRPDGVAKLTDMHRDLIAEGLLHGIEVANGDFYSAESLQIALDNDLAILGVSDVHYLIDWDYLPNDGGHRTATLVFAEERSTESIKEALHANRTVAWFGNWLIGREDALMPLLEASLQLTKVERSPGDKLIDIRLSNMSDAAFDLRVTSGHRFNGPPSTMRVEPHSDLDLAISGETRTSFEIAFEVLNAITAPETHPTLRLPVEVPPR